LCLLGAKTSEEILALLDESELEDLSSDDEIQDVTFVPAANCAASSSESEVDEEPPTPPAAAKNVTAKGATAATRRDIWRKKPFNGRNVEPDPPSEITEVKSVVAYFEEYFDAAFFDLAAQYTYMYALARSGKELKTCAAEIRKLFGMHILMGCNHLPRIKMYWSRNLKLSFISSTMKRDRFFQLRTNLHFVNTVNVNESITTNRLWKVQPIIDAVRGQCL
jgi:hypothetical protein